MKRPIDAIKIGERHRQDFGDVKELAASIAKHGLLQPVVITPDDLLIDGERRLKACRSLGQYEVTVNIVDPDDLLGAEFDANVQRKDFTRSEAVAIGRLIEERERPAAQERQRSRQFGKHKPGTANMASPGQVRDIAAKRVGLSKTSYALAKEVVEAAEQDPATYADLQSEMDETGNVAGTHRLLRQRQITTSKPPKAVTASRARIRVYKDKPTREVVARAMNALEQVGQALEGVSAMPHVSADEYAEWVVIVQRSLKSVREFQRLLREGRISDAS